MLNQGKYLLTSKGKTLNSAQGLREVMCETQIPITKHKTQSTGEGSVHHHGFFLLPKGCWTMNNQGGKDQEVNQE